MQDVLLQRTLYLAQLGYSLQTKNLSQQPLAGEAVSSIGCVTL